MSGDPAHATLGYVPLSERSSLGPAGGPTPTVAGASYYAGFQEDYARYTFLDASYKGGPRFKEGRDREGNTIFLKHERESDTRYARRRSMTTYRNYVGPIVDQYAMYVGTSKVSRSTREQFVEWIKNVDGASCSLHDAMCHAMTKGLLLGRWVTGCVLPRAPVTGNAPRTKANDTRVPYLVHIHPSNIVDYSQDSSGKFTRLVIHYEHRIKDSFAEPERVDHEYHEWTDTQLTIWKPKNPQPPAPTSTNGAALPVVTTTLQLQAGAPVAHGYGEIPFRMLWILEGKGIVEDVAEANKTVLNLTGLLYEELYNNTFSQTWVSGANENGDGDTKLGTSTVIYLTNPEAKVHSVGANPEQAASIMNALFMEVKEIHRMAHMEQSGEPLQKRVAEAASKVEKSHESMDQVLEHIADQMQTFENELLRMAAKYSTTAVNKDDLLSVWPRVFDTKSLREKISLAIELDKVPFVPKLVLKALAKQISDELVESDKFAAQAVTELEKMDRPRTATEVGISNAGAALGAFGPVQWYKIFVDGSKTDEEVRTILDEIKKDIEKYGPVVTPGATADPQKPANRPKKQPTPEEERAALATQQAANQT